jgi:hypothetical protein
LFIDRYLKVVEFVFIEGSKVALFEALNQGSQERTPIGLGEAVEVPVGDADGLEIVWQRALSLLPLNPIVIHRDRYAWTVGTLVEMVSRWIVSRVFPQERYNCNPPATAEGRCAGVGPPSWDQEAVRLDYKARGRGPGFVAEGIHNGTSSNSHGIGIW